MSMSLTAVVLFALAQVGATAVSPLPGATRFFGGQTITRRFRLVGEGNYRVEWRTRVLRGVVQRGEQENVAPGVFETVLKLPEVRARVDLVQELRIERKGKFVAGGRYALALFPRNILSQFAAGQGAQPRIGLVDPEGKIAPFFEKASVKFARLSRNIQVPALESKLVVVAPDQARSLAEPVEGVWELLEEGGTVIFLEHAGLPVDLFGEERLREGIVACVARGAQPVVGTRHEILRDVRAGDLANFGGRGSVASHLLPWPKALGFRPLLVSDDRSKPMPLVAEYLVGKGRAIVCQLEVGRGLEDEPIAQILLRNMIAYARSTPVRPPLAHVRMAVPPDAVQRGQFNTALFVPTVEDDEEEPPGDEERPEAAAIVVLISSRSETPPPEPGFDLPGFLRQDGVVIMQSGFGEESMAALKDLIRSTWRDDPRYPIPVVEAKELDGQWKPTVRYESKIIWGVTRKDVLEALAGTDQPRSITCEGEVPGWSEVIAPGLAVKFQRGKSCLVLCAASPEKEEEEEEEEEQEDNKARERLFKQIVTNLTMFQ